MKTVLALLCHVYACGMLLLGSVPVACQRCLSALLTFVQVDSVGAVDE